MLNKVSILLLAAILIFAGCSSDSNNADIDKTDATTTGEVDSGNEVDGYVKKELATVEDSIELALNEPWARLLYNDNSGFYEYEFLYLHDDVPIDTYLTYRQITYKMPNDVMNVGIDNIYFFRPDSAIVAVNVTLRTPEGKIEPYYDTIPVYYSDGRWIKPTVSSFFHQNEYLERIRQAIKAAEEED